ncbi:MAG: heavy-metal-associated domain-containing protein [Gammaproteobacteria bacterium]
MKLFLLSFLVLCVLSLDLAAQESDNNSVDGVEENAPTLSVGSLDPGGEIVTVNAFGLVCDFCATAIEKVFMRKDEVSGLNVSLADRKIIIALKNGQNIDDAEIEKLITDSGYNVKSIDRTSTGN